MKGIIRRLRPSPAMVVACIALVFAMTGAGYAAGMLGPNTVGTKQLKKNAVISSKVKNGSLLRADFKAGQIPAGPQGPAGPAGPQGAQGAPGTSVFASTIPVGTTIKGTWGVSTTAAGGFNFDTVGFVVPAPQNIAFDHVNFAAGTPGASDGDATCTGTAANPTAPPGKVCLYSTIAVNINELSGWQYSSAAGPLGFSVRAGATGAGDARGTWAYNASASAGPHVPSGVDGTGH